MKRKTQKEKYFKTLNTIVTFSSSFNTFLLQNYILIYIQPFVKSTLNQNDISTLFVANSTKKNNPAKRTMYRTSSQLD